MTRERFVFSLFHGEYIGGLDHFKDAPAYHGRKIPVIKKVKSRPGQLLKFWKSDREEFPYALDKEADMIKIDAIPGFPLLILVPNTDIPEFSRDEYERTIAYKIYGELMEQTDNLKDKLEKKQDRIDRLNKENRELRKEVEEREEKEASQRSSSSSGGVECPDCSSTNPEKKWEKNNDTCPSCGDVSLSEAKG
jgi:hypothetical protein